MHSQPIIARWLSSRTTPKYSCKRPKSIELQHRYDRLLATLDRLQDGVGIDDAPARVDMLQGIAMRKLGRAEEARRCFVRASTKDPQDATPHLELASLAIENGECRIGSRIPAGRAATESRLRPRKRLDRTVTTRRKRASSRLNPSVVNR